MIAAVAVAMAQKCGQDRTSGSSLPRQFKSPGESPLGPPLPLGAEVNTDTADFYRARAARRSAAGSTSQLLSASFCPSFFSVRRRKIAISLRLL